MFTLAFCIFGFIFILGAIPGLALILKPHQAIDASLRVYDSFQVLGIDRNNLRKDPHRNASVIFYRMFGVALIVVFALPLIALLQILI
jgi:hypothetical protein